MKSINTDKEKAAAANSAAHWGRMLEHVRDSRTKKTLLEDLGEMHSCRFCALCVLHKSTCCICALSMVGQCCYKDTSLYRRAVNGTVSDFILYGEQLKAVLLKLSVTNEIESLYDSAGYDKAGYNAEGYDDAGYNSAGYDEDGFNREGYDKDEFDEDGFDEDGFDKDGYGRKAAKFNAMLSTGDDDCYRKEGETK